MNRPSSRGRRNPDQAARDPGPGASNRPGFDLDGAVGDAKPDDSDQTKSFTVPTPEVVKQAASKVTDGVRHAESKRKAGGTGKSKSAVAGVRDWLRNK